MKKRFFVLLLASVPGKLVLSQNIGIGTATPAEKLHVAGNIKADTLKPAAIKLIPNAGTSKILTSDAEGNASWQTSSVTDGNIGYGVWGDCATNGNIGDYQPVADTATGSSNEFGNSVAISGNFAVIGDPEEDIGGITDRGTASVYRFNGVQWEFVQKLVDATGGASDFFGYSVSISGHFIIVGSYGDNVGLNANQGSVSIFQYNGTSWVLMQKITDAAGASNDFFGFSVAISGNFAVVGAYQDDNGLNTDQGSVSFYNYNGTSWVLQQKSFGTGGSASDFFGYSVSINGNYAAVGSIGDDVTTTSDGSVTIFKYNGINAWLNTGMVYSITPFFFSNFGASVSVTAEYLAVGEPSSTAAVPGGPQGKTFVYKSNGNIYSAIQEFALPATENSPVYYGASVFLSGNYLLIGVPERDVDGTGGTGEVIIYTRVGNYWQKMQVIHDPSGSANARFGQAVAIDGATKRFIVATGSNDIIKTKVIFGRIN